MEADLYTDSASALTTWAKVSSSQSLRGLQADTDLAEMLLGCSGLRVFKVKSHVGPSELAGLSPVEAWRCAGNHAADQAARKARELELPQRKEVASTLAEHWWYQRDHMLSFCAFLVELNVTDIRFKEAAEPTRKIFSDEAKRKAVDRHQRSLMEWTRPSPGGQPAELRVDLDGPWGRPFLSSLHAWALSLTWPPLPQPVQDDFSCTYLDMLANFVAWARQLPPTAIPTATGPRYLPSLHPAARLQPQMLGDMIGTFQGALLYLHAQDSTLLPARRMHSMSNLKALGLPMLLQGLDRRPVFPDAG